MIQGKKYLTAGSLTTTGYSILLEIKTCYFILNKKLTINLEYCTVRCYLLQFANKLNCLK